MKINNKINFTQGFSTVIITAVISILATLVVVVIVLSQFGVQEAADEVSPFVESAKTRLTEGIVPPTERAEPKTDADLILEAVARNQGSSVLLYKETVADDTFVARGLLVTTDGFIITDAAAIQAGVNYVITVPGKKEALPLVQLAEQDGLAILKSEVLTTQIARFSNEVPTVESLVVAINGQKQNQIATGIVNTAVTEDKVVTNIVGTMIPGVPLVSKEGFVIGIATAESYDSEGNAFMFLTKDYIDSLAKNSDSI